MSDRAARESESGGAEQDERIPAEGAGRLVSPRDVSPGTGLVTGRTCTDTEHEEGHEDAASFPKVGDIGCGLLPGLAASNEDVVNRNMNQLDKVSNESHNEEADSGGRSDLLELC